MFKKDHELEKSRKEKYAAMDDVRHSYKQARASTASFDVMLETLAESTIHAMVETVGHFRGRK